VAFGNPSSTCYACCGGEEKETSCTLVGCKCKYEGGLVGDDANLLRIFGGATKFG
jgi:hypothetical protein